MKKYKIGIIGAGAIVESSHLPVLKTLPAIDVSWIYDISDKRKQLLADMYQVRTIKENELKTAIDSVDICLLTIPFGARLHYINMIAAAGKAMYIEKPFALTVEQHLEYCSLFEPYKLAIGFQRREYRLVSELRSIISAGVFGYLKKIEFTQGYFTLKGGKGYLSDASLSGGGVIVESAIHTLDQLLLITAAEKVQVSRLKSLSEKGIDYDSSFTSHLFTENDTIAVDCHVSTLRNLENGIKFYFENAIVHSTTDVKPIVSVRDHNNKELSFTFSSSQDAYGSTATTVTQAFFFFWNKFIDGLKTKQANHTSGESSLLTTSWVEQVYNRLQQ